MKKFGFTMPELIVTLGIVGIAAAIAAPIIGNLMPDKNKLKAIECYNLVNAATEEFLSDEGIYFAPDEWSYHEFKTDGSILKELDNPIPVPDGYPDCEALMCWNNPPARVPYVNEEFVGVKKYPSLLFTKYGFSNITDRPSGQNNRVFSGTASDGTVWRVTPIDIIDETTGNIALGYDNSQLTGYKIEFDVNPNNGAASCSYNPDTCKSPDRFAIFVNHEGNVFAGDPMMEAYLSNPLNMNTKKEDREKALDINTNGDKDYDNPTFLYTAPNYMQ